MSKVYRVKGSTTDVTECELCGRVDLKGTIVLEVLDADGNGTGEVVYYGANCGAKAAGWTQRDIKQAAKTADQAARDAATREREARRDAEATRWTAWLTEQTGETEIPAALAKLGGFAAATAAYRAA